MCNESAHFVERVVGQHLQLLELRMDPVRFMLEHDLGSTRVQADTEHGL